MSLNKVVTKIQELANQKIISEAVTEENIRIKKEIKDLKKGLDEKVKKVIIQTLKDMAESGEGVTMYLPSKEEPTTQLRGVLFKINNPKNNFP